MEYIKGYKLFKESLDTEAINEAFSSSILRDLSSQSRGKWGGNLAKDMQKYANLALDKISDSDFTTTSPEAYWQGGDAKNPNKIGFFVDDDPEFIKWAKANKKFLPGDLNLGNISNYGIVLSVVRGGAGMWHGFATDSGGSYSRHRKGTEERYGVLAKEYDTNSVYRGYEGKDVVSKVTRKNLIDTATRVYVLDLDSLRDKYDVKGLVNDRADSKAGATALKSAKDIKNSNRQRYEAILKDKAAMTDIDQAVKDSMELLNSHITDAIAKGEMDRSGNFLIGIDKRGRGITVNDGANFLKGLLDDYQRYHDYKNQQAEAEAEGEGRAWYGDYVKDYAKRVTDRSKKIADKNYAW